MTGESAAASGAEFTPLPLVGLGCFCPGARSARTSLHCVIFRLFKSLKEDFFEIDLKFQAFCLKIDKMSIFKTF